MGVDMWMSVHRDTDSAVLGYEDPFPNGAKFPCKILHEMKQQDRITFAEFNPPEEKGAVCERKINPVDVRLFLAEMIDEHEYAVPTKVIDLLDKHEATPGLTWKLTSYH